MRYCLILFLLASFAGSAAAAADRDGTILKQESCPVEKESYEEFVQHNRTGYEQEVQSAARIGVTMPTVEERMRTLPDASRKEHRGFECLKITYLI